MGSTRQTAASQHEEPDRRATGATLRLDHGPVNVCDLEMFEAIADTFAALDADEDVDAIVLAGNDRAFSAGVEASTAA